MRRASALAILAALVLVPACSSSGDAGPAYHLAALRTLLVTSSEVDLPGYTATTPAGEQQSHTTIAITYFDRAGFTDSGLHASDVVSQLSVTLIATGSAAAARAASSTALTTATTSLRSITHSGSVEVGTQGRQVAGRTKGDGALQTSIFFVQDRVAVSVTLSSNTDDRPDLVTAVARVQAAKLQAG